MRLVKIGDIEGNAEDALLRQGVRGDFHHRFGGAVAQRLGQHLIQFQRFGRGVRRGQNFAGDVVFDRADERGLAPGRLQNRFQQK